MTAGDQPPDSWTAERLFAGPGDVLERLRSIDWASNPLGPVEHWSAELRMALRTLLPSGVPMLLWWGPELIQFPNDAIVPALGDKYPAAVAQPAAECWSDVWDVVESRVAQAMAGTTSYAENELLFMHRHGYVEETYWTFSYSPVCDETGAVVGVFVATNDVTATVVGERRLEALSRLGNVTIGAAGATPVDTSRAALDALDPNPFDLPVATIYLDTGVIDPDGSGWTTAASFGLRPGARLLGDDEAAVLAEVVSRGEPTVISGIAERSPDLLDPSRGLGRRPVDQVWLAPLTVPRRDSPIGVLAFGLNPYRPFDQNYASFVSLVVTKVSGLLRDADTLAAERERADALAALDETKSRFLESISHEFRTPLTLVLGSLQEALEHGVSMTGEQRQALMTAQRAAGRLQRLVDTLLEAARMQDYLVQADLRPTDPAALTAHCVELFREPARRAELDLRADIADEAARRIELDPQIWSHLVINLLSNAVKYTPSGSVEVALDVDGHDLVLTVADTGIGIHADELDRIFDRFHRVDDPAARSREGIGLGLSLVRDWARMIGGSVSVESEPGVGSSFTVKVPMVSSASDAVVPPAGTVPLDTLTPYIDETVEWRTATPGGDEPANTGDALRILVIEDNADMRDYLCRLLRREGWAVDAVGDGINALDRIRSRPPHLVLSDIMIPGPDGVAVLERIRSDPATARLPVILLTARAGEGDAVGGLQTGADDYITKPFRPDELVARVRVNLEMSWLREQLMKSKEKESEQLRVALETRSTMSQAVGLLMAALRCDADTAFEKLVGFSQHRNVKVRDIAEEIVADYTSSLSDGSAGRMVT